MTEAVVALFTPNKVVPEFLRLSHVKTPRNCRIGGIDVYFEHSQDESGDITMRIDNAGKITKHTIHANSFRDISITDDYGVQIKHK